MTMDPDHDEYVSVMDSVLAASPVLRKSWEGEYESGDERLPWIEGGVVARFLARMVQDDPSSRDLKNVSNAIEAAFASDCDNGFLQIAIIEAIQNVTSNMHDRAMISVTAGDVKAHLGPLSQASWEALDEAWGNSVDDI
jgi:hypothetical protein